MSDGQRKRFWTVGAVYLAITIAFTYPFSMHLGSQLLSVDSDSLLIQWILAWDVHAFTHQPFHIFDANTFAPLPNTLAFAENLIGGALMAAPIIWLTGNIVLALNAVSVLSIPLSGLGTYLLARRVNVSFLGAFLAGLVFAFTPPRFLRIEQFQLTTIQWIPFCLAYVHAYLDGGRARDLRIALVFFSLQALTGGHGAAFLMAGIVALLIYRFGLGEPLEIVQRLKDMGVAGALALLPTILVFLPYRAAQANMGLARNLDGWATAPSSFLASPTHIDLKILGYLPAWASDRPDAYLFPGWVPLAILLMALLFPRRRPVDPTPRATIWLRRATLLLEVIAVVYAVTAVYALLSDAPRLKLFGVEVMSFRHSGRLWLIAGAALALRLWLRTRVPLNLAARAKAALARRWAAMRVLRHNSAIFYLFIMLFCAWLLVGPPYGVWQYVYEWPILSFIRVPTRFVLLGLVGLSVLAGMAYDRIVWRFSRATRVVIGGVVCTLCLIEFAAMPMEGRPPRNEIPAIDRWLNTLPKPFTIAEVPLPDPENVGLANALNAAYIVHSTAHWQKTVNGWSGLLPPEHQDLFAALWKFPDTTSLDQLDRFGVTYVVVHAQFTDAQQRAQTDAEVVPFASRMTLVHEEADGRVYALHRPGAK